MPKTPKTSIIPNKEKNFIYQTQSPKKTHCHKTINNHYYNTQPEIILDKPINHWTENRNHPNWEYYAFTANQINLAAAEFKKTQDWQHWQFLQKNFLIIKALINTSVNLTYHEPEEIKELNEKVVQNHTKNQQKGKIPQTRSQQ